MVTGISLGCRELIEHQRGVLARWQVADNELDRSCVDNLLRSARWQRLYLGVYAAFTGVPARESLIRQVQVSQGGRSAYLDNLYADFGVASELDGGAWHPEGERWRDIRRANYAARSGIITLRYNWADLTARPCQVAMEVASVLRQRGWTGTLRPCGPTCQASPS